MDAVNRSAPLAELKNMRIVSKQKTMSNHEKQRRVTIHGGGLAGLSLGIALQKRGIKTVVHEAGHYPRHRVCGEFISGVSQATLERLGIAALLSDALQVSEVIWYQGDRRIREDSLPVPAYGISRWRLDQRLAEAFVTLGGQLHVNSRVRCEPKPGLIDATGRKAKRDSNWIGLKFHVRHLEARHALEMYVSTAGYVGISPVEDGVHNLCGLFRLRKHLPRVTTNLLEDYLLHGGFTTLAKRLEGCEILPGSQCAVSALDYAKPPDPMRVAVGDARALIPPFTGNGMSLAFESADSAVEPLSAWAAGSITWEVCQQQMAERLRQRHNSRLRHARCLHGLLMSPRWQPLFTSFASQRPFPFRQLYHLTHA